MFHGANDSRIVVKNVSHANDISQLRMKLRFFYLKTNFFFVPKATIAFVGVIYSDTAVQAVSVSISLQVSEGAEMSPSFFLGFFQNQGLKRIPTPGLRSF